MSDISTVSEKPIHFLKIKPCVFGLACRRIFKLYAIAIKPVFLSKMVIFESTALIFRR